MARKSRNTLGEAKKNLVKTGEFATLERWKIFCRG